MEKFMLQSWWKWLGVLLVVYGLVAGLLVPLKPNLVSVSPNVAVLGQQVDLMVTGYNTTFTKSPPGELRAWLRAGEEASLEATEISVLDDRRATLRFELPAYLPDSNASQELSLIMTSSHDGSFVAPSSLTIRRQGFAADPVAGQKAWSKSQIQKGDLYETPRMTYPYRGLLAETIRNIYFHVSLWFAMIILFTTAVVYSVRTLRFQSAIQKGKMHKVAIHDIAPWDKSDEWASAFTSIGMLFGILGLTTGAMWARYTWGSFWSWDIKQFTTLIALLIYAGYFVLRASFPEGEQRARLGSAYNIFAFICLIPLIYILPRLSGNSLHPGAAGNPALGGEDLDSTMRMVFYPIIIGWTLIGCWMATIQYRIRIIKLRFEDME